MMHVIFRDGLEDREWLEKYTSGPRELRERVREWTPPRAAETTGLTVAEIEGFAREYATTRPSAIRVNYGLNRHAGGGMAVRTIACLPALVGAWRDAGGGVLLSVSGTFPVTTTALQRPDLIRPGTRTLNMSQLGRILNDPKLDPPVKALFVYNCNPGPSRPSRRRSAAGFMREDLFTVVHEQFQTDTADFADLVLPATTTLEHYDIHKAYGHLYISLSRPAIAPVGESQAQHGGLPPAWPRAWASTIPRLRESDEQMARQACAGSTRTWRGSTSSGSEREGSVRLSVPDPYAPFAEGGFPTPSGKCELLADVAGASGLDPLAGLHPAARERADDAGAGRRYPARLHLAARAPLPELHLLRAAGVRAARGRAEPDDPPRRTPPRAASPTGRWSAPSTTAARSWRRRACRTTARPGVVVGLSIWWAKMCPGGRNANAVTSQELTDMGGGATFYDALVEVAPA